MTREPTGADKGGEGPLELDLTIEPGLGLSGTIAPRAHQARLTSFSGWLGLAEAIDVLRRDAEHPQAPPKQPDASETGWTAEAGPGKPEPRSSAGKLAVCPADHEPDEPGAGH